MRLLLTTPVAIVVDSPDASYIRAEDETGAFGILPGHADFITALAVSVITWRDRKGDEHHVAVRGGLMTVRDGDLVEIATREAVGDDTLRELGQTVLGRFREEAQVEEQSRVSAQRLHFAAIRQLQRFVESGRQTPQRPPAAFGGAMEPDGLPGEGEPR